MDLYEYQAKDFLKRCFVPVSPFEIGFSKEEIASKITEFLSEEMVLKIQVHAGGRGKAGGVKVARSKEEAQKIAEELHPFHLVNNQTGARGVFSKGLLLSPLEEIETEYYLSLIIDRQIQRMVFILSKAGGVEIEETAKNTPEEILYMPLSADHQIYPFHIRKAAAFMHWKEDLIEQGAKILTGMVEAFHKFDASLIEINPLILSKKGTLIALDAKMSIDDNALFRQKECVAFEDFSHLTEQEKRALESNLSYISLDGNVGCMVNGAGLAMATMDIIRFYGGNPANFLDVGGSATKEKVEEGFHIITSDPHVKILLVNIFGGIMNCATIAEGLVSALQNSKKMVPVVVRLEGTNVDEGKRICVESGLPLHFANDLGSAAETVVELLRKES